MYVNGEKVLTINDDFKLQVEVKNDGTQQLTDYIEGLVASKLHHDGVEAQVAINWERE